MTAETEYHLNDQGNPCPFGSLIKTKIKQNTLDDRDNSQAHDVLGKQTNKQTNKQTKTKTKTKATKTKQKTKKFTNLTGLDPLPKVPVPGPPPPQAQPFDKGS